MDVYPSMNSGMRLPDAKIAPRAYKNFLCFDKNIKNKLSTQAVTKIRFDAGAPARH
jgi:hypothetical protein